MDDDDMQPEYDFSNGIRGKDFDRYQEGTNLILLDPEIPQASPDAASVNAALRLSLDAARHTRSS